MIRSLVASLTGLLAALLLPLGVVSVWTHEIVSDTDRYVETVTPLADDDVVRAAAVEELEREALQLAATSGPLPDGTDALVHLVVQQVVASPTFRTAWAQANRAAHEQLVAVLEDRRGARLDSEGRVSIDLGTVFSAIAQDLADQGLVDPAAAADIDASFAVMDGDQLTRAQRAYDTLDTLGLRLPLAWAALVVLTLLLARRRLATAARLAVASLVTLGLLALVLLFARDALTVDLPQREVALAVWDVVVASLWRAVEVGAVALAVVALAGVGLAAVLGRRAAAPPGTDPDGVLEWG